MKNYRMKCISLALLGAISYRPELAMAQVTTAWTKCSDENRVCDLPTGGARMARYGANGQFITKAFTTAFDCQKTVFGSDPAPGYAKACYYGDQIYQEIAPQVSNMMGPWVNNKRIPIGHIGSSRAITEPVDIPVADGESAFRIACNYSHMNFDDAIVYPNQPGASHLHAYFGNTSINYASTTTYSVRFVGNSTCAGGKLNRSAYWVPALVDTRNGTPVAPTTNVVYYKSHAADRSAIKAMPLGIRVLAGSMRQSAEDQVDLRRTHWRCKSKTGPRPGLDESAKASIPNCPVGTYLWMIVQFPQCWDGRRLDSPDHRAHMAYGGATCPASHPVHLPEISYHIEYKIENANDPLHWRLSSDMYGTDKPGGYSMHADWINGWDRDTLERWVQECIREGRSTNNTTCDGIGLSRSVLKNQEHVLTSSGN